MKMNYKTVVYIDWFYLCHMSIWNFVSECVSLIKNLHRHLLHTIPTICTVKVPATVDTLISQDCEEMLHYLNNDPADDMDFLHDIHLMNSIHMEVDYELLRSLVDKHATCEVYVMCPIRSSILQLISVSYLSKLAVPKVHITEHPVSEIMQDIANTGKRVLLYTEVEVKTFLPKDIYR